MKSGRKETKEVEEGGGNYKVEGYRGNGPWTGEKKKEKKEAEERP